MKQCKACMTPIDDAATKCPQCRADQRNWFARHKFLSAILGLILLLVVTGMFSQPQTKTASNQAPAAVKTPATTPVPDSKQPPYFDTVWRNLDHISKASQPMNQSCSKPFPAPEPCHSDVAAYRNALLGTERELRAVTAPASFAQADATLRGALQKDLEASSKALVSLETKNLAGWLDALAKHGQAGADLNRAGAQAWEVMQ